MKAFITILGLAALSVAASGAPVACTNVNQTSLYNTAVLGVGETTATGCLTTPTGVHSEGEWSPDDFTIAWRVTLIEDGPDTGAYLYEYTLNTNAVVSDTKGEKSAAVSHWILEVSPVCNDDAPCIFDSNVGFGEIKNGNGDKGNPGLEEDLYGVKFDNAGEVDGTTHTYSFLSYQVPVWGNFYAKDGTGTYGWNQGLGADPLVANYFIARVDTITSSDPVPEPAAYPVMLVALIGGWYYMRRRKAAIAVQ